MTQLTIECPHCTKSFELTEALAGPLLETERKKVGAEVDRRLATERDSIAKKASATTAAEYAEKLKASEAALADRDSKLLEAQAAELKLRAEREQLEQAKREIDLTVQRRVDAEKKAAVDQVAAAMATDFGAKLKATEAALAERDAKLRQAQEAELQIRAEREKLAQSQQELELTVQRRVDTEKKAAAEEAAAITAAEFLAKLKGVEATMAEKDAKLKVAEANELHARKLKQEAEEEKRQVELTVARRIDEERTKVRDEALRERDAELRLKLSEKDKQIDAMRQQVEEMRRKGDSVSSQLVGEVMELDLLDVLRSAFPGDTIDRVKKGQSGADIVHTVRNAAGKECGKILWESKRTKNWSDGWLSKLREDQRVVKADVAALMSETLPEGLLHFDVIEGVWVTCISTVVPMATALRQGLIETATAHRVAAGSDIKKDLVYSYLTGNGFRQRVRGALEPIVEMRTDLEREKRLISKHWGAREKQIDRTMQNMVAMHGDLQGIMGSSLPVVEGLSLLDVAEPAEQPKLSVVNSDAIATTDPLEQK